MNERQPSVRLSRVLKIVVPVALLAVAAYVWSRTWETNEREKTAEATYAKILGSQAGPTAGAMAHPDKDGDLIADSPDDPKQCIKPDVLTFSYIAGDTESVPEAEWKEFLAALKQKTGHEVKYVHFDATSEELEALKKGDLHIAGLNTGVVPAAVQQTGFVPLCTFGQDDGTSGITMQVIVPADSHLKNLTDLKGHKIMFTRPDSNSGCKALLMLLKDKDLQPDRDYSWGFTTSHEDSAKGIASKQYEAAPVASDRLQLMIKNGDVKPESYRIIYESDRFPAATIGYVYNLTPELRTAIRDALKDFSLKGTGLDGKMGTNVTKLVPVDYKKDWESVRKIEELAAKARTKHEK